jgi:hypothetical protein
MPHAMEAAVGTNRKGHRNLAGRRIVGELQIKAQGMFVWNGGISAFPVVMARGYDAYKNARRSPGLGDTIYMVLLRDALLTLRAQEILTINN